MEKEEEEEEEEEEEICEAIRCCLNCVIHTTSVCVCIVYIPVYCYGLRITGSMVGVFYSTGFIQVYSILSKIPLRHTHLEEEEEEERDGDAALTSFLGLLRVKPEQQNILPCHAPGVLPRHCRHAYPQHQCLRAAGTSTLTAHSSSRRPFSTSSLLPSAPLDFKKERRGDFKAFRRR